MSVRSALPFLIMVFLVAIGGVYLALQFFQEPAPETRTMVVTIEVFITATTDPNRTPEVIIVTATPDRTQVAVPDNLVPAQGTSIETTSVAQAQGTPLATGDAAAQAENALPAGCILHTIEEGDSPFGVAIEYDADPFLLLQVNGLDEESARNLRPGDTLIVPLEGCPIEQLPGIPTDTPVPTATSDATEEVTEEATEEPANSPTPTVTPTITLAPTAVNAQVEIVGVENVGDITEEAVRIRNNGRTVNLTGWTLSDADGNEFVFSEHTLFSNQELVVYTRSGDRTPVAVFWGLDVPVWQPGDVVTLRDQRGQVQAVYRIEQARDLN